MSAGESATGQNDQTVSTAMRRGTPFVLLGHLASQLIGLGTLAILYRMLKPADYGVFSVVLPAVMLPRMAATLGPGIAVMQRRELSSSQLSVLFWLQALAGVLAVIITTALSWILAISYRQPILLPLGSVLAGGTLLAVLGNQHQALLERDLRFGTGSILRLVAQFIACAAAIAWAGYRPDVWALVMQHVVELGILCAGSWLLAGWRPQWPARPWQVQEVLHFSLAYSASSLVYFLSQNIEKVLLPLFFGAASNAAVGLYSQAFNLMIKPVYLLTTPLTGVMVSSLAKAPPGSELYATLTAKFFRISALGLFPCAIGLMLVSDDVVNLLGGDSWLQAGPLLRWLAPSLAAIGFMNLAIFVLASRGMGRALLIASLWLLVLTIQSAMVGIYAARIWLPPQGDPAYPAATGLAAAFTMLQIFVWCLPFVWFALKSVGVSPATIAWALFPSARAAVLMGLVVFGGQQLLAAIHLESLSLRLLILVGGGAASYAALTLRELIQLRQDWLSPGNSRLKMRKKRL